MNFVASPAASPSTASLKWGRQRSRSSYQGRVHDLPGAIPGCKAKLIPFLDSKTTSSIFCAGTMGARFCPDARGLVAAPLLTSSRCCLTARSMPAANSPPASAKCLRRVCRPSTSQKPLESIAKVRWPAIIAACATLVVGVWPFRIAMVSTL